MSLSCNNFVILPSITTGKKWRSDPGFIIAKMVTVNGKTYPLAGVDGIRVAVVLADPTILPGKDNFHETQSKVIAISGSGFTNVADTKIVIRPTSPGAYRVLAVLEDTIIVQLKQGSSSLLSLFETPIQRKFFRLRLVTKLFIIER
jgi:hypothetical protein